MCETRNGFKATSRSGRDMSSSDPAMVRSSVSSGLDQQAASHHVARRDTRLGASRGSAVRPQGPPDSRGMAAPAGPRQQTPSLRSRGGLETRAPQHGVLHARKRSPCIWGVEGRCCDHRARAGASLLRLRPARCVRGRRAASGPAPSAEPHRPHEGGRRGGCATNQQLAARSCGSRPRPSRHPFRCRGLRSAP
jgi:hypothetical protein